MRGLLIGAMAAAAACGLAIAQPPSGAQQAPPAVAVGATFDYVTSYGRTLRMTLVEAADDRFIWELQDVTRTPRLAARITQDAKFRILVNEDTSGGITRYEPHNCEKVVGICSYTVRRPDGGEAEEMRVNGIADGVWNYSLWRGEGSERRPVGIGEICYDAAGVSLRESWTDLETAAGYSVERILPGGGLADCSGAVAPLE